MERRHGSRTLLTRGSIERMKSLVSISTAKLREESEPSFCEKIKMPFTLKAHRRGFLYAIAYLLGLPAVMIQRIHNYGVATTYYAYCPVMPIDSTCGHSFLKALEFYLGALGSFLLILPVLIGLIITGHTQKISYKWINWGLVLLAVSAAFLWDYVIYLFPDHPTVARQGFGIMAFFAMQTNNGQNDPTLRNILSWLFHLKDLPVLVFPDGYVQTVFKIMLGTFTGLTVGVISSVFVLQSRAEHKLMSNLEKSLRKIENIMVPLIALDSGIVENESIFKELVQHDLILESRNLEFSDFIDIKTKIWNHIEDAYLLLQPDKLLIEAARVEKFIPKIYFGRLSNQSIGLRSPPASSSSSSRGGGGGRGATAQLRRANDSLDPEVHILEQPSGLWQRFKHWYDEDCIRPRLSFTRFSYPVYEACVENVLALFFHVTSLYLTLETNEALLNDGIANNDHIAWGATLRIGNDVLSISKNKSPNIRKYLTEPDFKYFFENHGAHQHHDQSVPTIRKGFLLSGFENNNDLSRFECDTRIPIDEMPSQEEDDDDDGSSIGGVGGAGGRGGGGDGGGGGGGGRIHHDTPPPGDDGENAAGGIFSLTPTTTPGSHTGASGMGEKNRVATRSVHDLNALEVVDIISKSTLRMEQTPELATCMQPLIKWSNDFGPCIGRISQNIAAYIQSLGDSVAAGRMNDRVYAELSEVRYSLKELCLLRRTWQSKTEDVLRINLANMWHQGSTLLSDDPLYIREMLGDVLGVTIEEYANMSVTDRGLLWSNLGYVRDKLARFSCTIVVLTSQLHQVREPIEQLLSNAGHV